MIDGLTFGVVSAKGLAVAVTAMVAYGTGVAVLAEIALAGERGGTVGSALGLAGASW